MLSKIRVSRSFADLTPNLAKRILPKSVSLSVLVFFYSLCKARVLIWTLRQNYDSVAAVICISMLCLEKRK